MTKGATRQAGCLPIWRKDGMVWIELAPAQFDQPLLMSVNISGSVGERGLCGSQMGPTCRANRRRWSGPTASRWRSIGRSPSSRRPRSQDLTTLNARSLVVGCANNIAKPAATPMRPRLTDPRFGQFFDVVTDLPNDLRPNPRQHLATRSRLENKDPSAERPEPRQPIVPWLDENSPPRYRKSVEAGILEWNKALDRIGFKDAIEARQQPDDADRDTMDARHASIR